MNEPTHRLCVAPMMDWTDRHCRYFLRLISRRARLYTEMITSGALAHGDVPHHLDFDPAEHPLALQLGGSDPDLLARSAVLGERWGYDEINLNCGCPSERVQTGSFGACLMAEPALVADCVKAMRDAVAIPVTVKHRIGLDHGEEYGFVRDFVGTVAGAGCGVFIVHARNAVLKGLSPKENREVPPLRYDVVRRLKCDFPALTIVVNGGLADWDAIGDELRHVDGVMLGRVAYHDPYFLAVADARLFGDETPSRSRSEVLHALMPYAQAQLARGVPLRAIARHVLGLYHGRTGGRRFRRILSDSAKLRDAGPELFLEALDAVEPVPPPTRVACRRRCTSG
jgi:tRNA-dihydrouridine synthase A